MADELRYAGTQDETGLTVVAGVYDANGDLQAGPGLVSCPETNLAGLYVGDMPGGILIGTYTVKFTETDENGNLLGYAEIEWDGTQEYTNMFLATEIGVLSLQIAAVGAAVAAVAADVWDFVIEGVLTAKQSLRLLNPVNAGKTSGPPLGTAGTVIARDPDDTKDRITADVDENGYRTSVTYDVTD